jgi:hypothetical protein
MSRAAFTVYPIAGVFCSQLLYCRKTASASCWNAVPQLEASLSGIAPVLPPALIVRQVLPTIGRRDVRRENAVA